MDIGITTDVYDFHLTNTINQFLTKQSILVSMLVFLKLIERNIVSDKHLVDALVCITNDGNMEVMKCYYLRLRTSVVDPRRHGRRELKHLSTCRKIYLRYSVSSGE